MEKKKGIELNQAFGAVLTIVLVAVLIIVAIVIFVSLNDSFAGTSTGSVVNETITRAELTAGSNSVSVDGTSNCSSADFAMTQVLLPNGTIVESGGNYSFSAAGLYTNTSSAFSDDSLLTTYTYTWGSEACTASNNMTDEFSNYTSLLGLVGTIIFLGLVIGVLVASFAFGGRREV